MNTMFIVAHRGGEGPYEENTLAAMQYGLEQCGNAVEMDVRFDHYRKRFYLAHDFFNPPKIKENTIDKVIPFLPSKATLFIDLKTLSWLRRRYALQFLKVIEQFALDKRAIIISFNIFVLVHLKNRAPYLHVGYLIRNRVWGWVFRNWVFWLLKPNYVILNCKFFQYKKSVIERMLKFAHKHHMKVFTYTPNAPQDWYNAVEYKFDGVITDYPKKACVYFTKHQGEAQGTHSD